MTQQKNQEIFEQKLKQLGNNIKYIRKHLKLMSLKIRILKAGLR